MFRQPVKKRWPGSNDLTTRRGKPLPHLPKKTEFAIIADENYRKKGARPMLIADLHLHSRYSRATSADCDAPHLELWARMKGVALLGTGDFTHPKWRQELQEQLEPAEEGLYTLKEGERLPCPVAGPAPRFVLSGEISTIYKQDGKTRKVHHVILLPGLEEAEALARRLEAIGNLHSDGRPILGLDSRTLLEITLDCCPRAIFIPAHIWTPHFSVFGAFSDFHTLEECYGDLTPEIHALETGLSSDPPMNRRLSMLDGYQLVSNSDAHSPAKLGREANLLDCALSYSGLKRALETGEGLRGTVEFYPEEGKYHLDGHRACQCRLEPAETLRLGGLCPVCGKKVTIGVLHRVEQLADRPAPIPLPKPFESLMPLPELIGEALGVSSAGKKVQAAYLELLQRLGPEFEILRDCAPDALEKAGGPLLGEALRRLRAGKALRQAGYDGEYGVVRLFAPGERERFLGQTSYLPGLSLPLAGQPSQAPAPIAPAQEKETPAAQAETLNPEQLSAVRSDARTVAVSAGPGTGKTKTLVARIAYLIEEKGVAPGEITAVTFTRQAAAEMAARLEARLGKKAATALHIGTFHALCLKLVAKKPFVSPEKARALIAPLLTARGCALRPRDALEKIAAQKNGLAVPELPQGLREEYDGTLAAQGLRDLEDVLLEALALPADKKQFHYLLVDEYQDLNAVQRALTEHWSRGRSLFVIGDPDQSIYGFRGADAGCFAALLAARPETECIRLHRNYRSEPAIIESALSVIARNPGPARALTPCRAGGHRVRVVNAGSEEAEADWIAREIGRMAGGLDMLSAREQGETRAFSEIAVLCRARSQLEGVERALAREGIPCLVLGRGDFLEDEKAQGLLCFFSALLNGDGEALSQALAALWGYPLSLRERAAAALSAAGAEGLAARLSDADALAPFLRAAETARPGLTREKPRKLLERLCAETGCENAAVRELLRAAVFCKTMPEFLALLREGEEQDIRRLTGGKPSGAVRLMTLHAAKGLEFPVVFLAGATEGRLPLTRAGEEENIQEERRLFYVGITRARETLILSCGGRPSPFLAELPDTCERQLLPRAPLRARQTSLFG